MSVSKLDKPDYILSIKRIELTAAGAISVVARVKYKGQYATIVFDGSWKFYYEHPPVPKAVILDAKEELQQRVQKIIEKIDEILDISGGLGLVIEFK